MKAGVSSASIFVGAFNVLYMKLTRITNKQPPQCRLWLLDACLFIWPDLLPQREQNNRNLCVSDVRDPHDPTRYADPSGRQLKPRLFVDACAVIATRLESSSGVGGLRAVAAYRQDWTEYHSRPVFCAL